MNMFSMGDVKSTKVVSTNFLRSGIHNVFFKGIDKSEDGKSMQLTFEAVDGSGIHIERIFEPRSAERKESLYGPNPSESEQFMCKIKQVIDALDPTLSVKIEKEGEKFSAPTFDAFIALIKKYLDKVVDTQTQIKLVPTTGNYVGFPGFIARLNKEGGLFMTTKVIGEDLVLTSKEMTAIETAATAKPTVMKKDDELDDLREDFGGDNVVDEDDDELPF